MKRSGPFSRRWRRGLGLCALLALAALLWPGEGEPPSAGLPDGGPPETVQAEGAPPGDSAGGVPQAIGLEVQELDAPALPQGDPAAAMDSEDVLFTDRLASGAELEIRRANPVRENKTVFYDVYALTRDPDQNWRVLGLLAGYNHYVMNGLDLAERVPDIMGREGWQISLEVGAAAVSSWYFADGPEGVEFLLHVGSSGAARVLDLDGDGQGEAAAYYNHGYAGWYFYDYTPEGGWWEYYLPTGPDASAKVELIPGEGFAAARTDGALARYVLEDGALRLWRSGDAGD